MCSYFACCKAMVAFSSRVIHLEKHFVRKIQATRGKMKQDIPATYNIVTSSLVPKSLLDWDARQSATTLKKWQIELDKDNLLDVWDEFTKA